MMVVARRGRINQALASRAARGGPQNAFGAKLHRQYECAIDGSSQVVNGKIVE